MNDPIRVEIPWESPWAEIITWLRDNSRDNLAPNLIPDISEFSYYTNKVKLIIEFHDPELAIMFKLKYA